MSGFSWRVVGGVAGGGGVVCVEAEVEEGGASSGAGAEIVGKEVGGVVEEVGEGAEDAPSQCTYSCSERRHPQAAAAAAAAAATTANTPLCPEGKVGDGVEELRWLDVVEKGAQ